MTLLGERGRLQGYRDGRAARAALIARWREECLHAPQRGLILAHDRREVAVLNALARAERDAAGLLGAERLMAGGREWAVGDRLTCRRNDYRLDLRNGTRGTVASVDATRGAITLRTDEGRIVELPRPYLVHAEHGYATTGHVSQGETVDRTYLLGGPDEAAGNGPTSPAAGTGSSSGCSRWRLDEERMEEALAAAWSRSQAKRLALDLAIDGP